MTNISKDTLGAISKIPNLQERAKLCISTEDIGEYVSELSVYFINKIHSIVDIFNMNRERHGSIDGNELNTHLETLLDNRELITDIIANVQYNTVAKIEVPVILGLDMNLIDAVSSVNMYKDDLTINVYKRLDEIDTILSKFIGDVNYRTSSRPINIDTKGNNSSAMRSTMMEIINPNLLIDRRPIEFLLPNMSSLNGIFAQLMELTGAVSVNNLKKIDDSIKTITNKTKALYELLSNKDTKVNSMRVDELSYYLEEVAMLTTVNVSFIHIVNQLAITTNLIVSEIKTRVM